MSSRCGACSEPFDEPDVACAGCGAPRFVVEPFLEIVSGASDGVGRTIPERGLVVGREPQRSDVALNDATVSRIHATIRRDEGRCVVHDEQSTSGVLVDGRRVEGQRALRHGSTVQFGNTHAVVYLPTATEEGA